MHSLDTASLATSIQCRTSGARRRATRARLLRRVVRIQFHYFSYAFQAGPSALTVSASGVVPFRDPSPVSSCQRQSVFTFQRGTHNKRVEAIAIRCAHVKASLSALGFVHFGHVKPSLRFIASQAADPPCAKQRYECG
jgi:hypothetical protein